MKALVGVAVVGAVLAALCCAGVGAAMLVAGVTALGLGALTRSFDALLLPTLIVVLILAAVGWARGRRARARSDYKATDITRSSR